VDTAFGCPGAAILPMYDAMHGSGIEQFIVGDEEGPTHMADGWARTTGGVGVAIGISGPAGTMERPLILAGGGVVARIM
jgi:tartronate-semialdehyde synthase